MAFATPLVRNTRLLDALPDPFEAYLRPSGGLSHFYMFPWAGFVAAGALVGVLIDRARTREDESRLNSWIFAAGVSVALASYAASFLPTPFEHSEFWGSSPAFFLLRTGLMIATVGIAYAWVRRTAGWGWTPLEQLGRTSLFIYWIHVEMVYGLISLRMHKALSLPAAWGAFALFTLLMFACSLAKDRVTAWKDRPQSPQAPAFAPH
jgi:uncharacterized membrane protein